MKVPIGGEIVSLVKRYGKEMIEQKYTLPDGTVSDFVMMRAKAAPCAAIVFPLTHDNQVVAVRQFRYGADAIVLEIPGGNPEGIETPTETITAELAEETGYRPERVEVMNPKSRYWFDPASMRAWYVPVLALGCERVQEPDPDPTEFIEVVTVPLAEWVRKIAHGEISDSKTVTLTFLALAKLDMLDLVGR